MLKRFIALLAVIALFAGLSACIKKPAEDKAGDEQATEGEGEYSIMPVIEEKPPIIVDNGDNSATDPDAPVSHDAGDVASPDYPHDASALYGSWRLAKVLAYGSVGTYSREEAEALVGTILTFSEDKAEVLTDTPSDPVGTIDNPTYAETEFDRETFYAEFRKDFPSVVMAYDTLHAIKIAGEGRATGVVLFNAQDEIILIAGGTFFALERMVKCTVE